MMFITPMRLSMDFFPVFCCVADAAGDGRAFSASASVLAVVALLLLRRRFFFFLAETMVATA